LSRCSARPFCLRRYAAALLDDALRARLDGRDLHPAPSPLALDADTGLGAPEVGEEVVGEGLVVHEVIEDGVDLLARTLDRGGNGDGLHARHCPKGSALDTLVTMWSAVAPY
jgi:hypothetical protein